MSRPDYHRLKYRNDPEFRERAIQRAKDYAAKADALRKRRARLSKRVYGLREYIARHQEKIATLEKRLIHVAIELEKVKSAIKNQGRRNVR